MPGINLVHGGELLHVGKEHGGFDHVGQRQLLGGEQRLDVGDDLLGLRDDAAIDELARVSHERNLSGEKDESSRGDAL
jgi:hypothetical protein